MTDNIKKLYSARTVCGSEHDLAEFIKERLADRCDEISCDDMGNVYALKKGTGKSCRKIAVVCAADEPGFVVTHVAENGRISLHAVGTKDCGKYLGMKAESADGTQGILLSDISLRENIGASDMYFETGAESAGDVTLKEGDFISVLQPPVALGKNKISLGVMGEKIFAECLAIIAECGGNYCFDTYFVFVSQHTFASRGEKCAAYILGADTVIALCTAESGRLSCGNGAVILTADSGGRCSRTLTKELCDAAEGIGVKLNKCADITKGKPSFISPFIAEGARTALVGACCEKTAEGANICDLRDIRSAAATVCAYLIFEDEKENNTEA